MLRVKGEYFDLGGVDGWGGWSWRGGGGAFGQAEVAHFV